MWRISRIALFSSILVSLLHLTGVEAAVCDVDNNIAIDRSDIDLIVAARGAAAGVDDPRDADGDGAITVNDARQCVLQCTLPRCAPVNPNAIDNDADGYTETQGDCNNTDPSIHPGAVDIPGNGIDEDCNGADAVQAISYIKASNTNASDFFGGWVAFSADGSTLAVSAIGEASAATGVDGDQTDNSASDSGAVYVFIRDGDGWQQQAYLKASNTGAASDTDAGEWFGTVALSADGSTLAVGAVGEDSAATGVDGDQTDNSASGSGAVYVFIRDGDSWQQQAYVKASNTDAGDRYGFPLALSANGDTLAVAAPYESSAATGINGDQLDNSAPAAGAVYIYSQSILYLQH